MIRIRSLLIGGSLWCDPRFESLRSRLISTGELTRLSSLTSPITLGEAATRGEEVDTTLGDAVPVARRFTIRGEGVGASPSVAADALDGRGGVGSRAGTASASFFFGATSIPSTPFTSAPVPAIAKSRWSTLVRIAARIVRQQCIWSLSGQYSSSMPFSGSHASTNRSVCVASDTSVAISNNTATPGQHPFRMCRARDWRLRHAPRLSPLMVSRI